MVVDQRTISINAKASTGRGRNTKLVRMKSLGDKSSVFKYTYYKD